MSFLQAAFKVLNSGERLIFGQTSALRLSFLTDLDISLSGADLASEARSIIEGA